MKLRRKVPNLTGSTDRDPLMTVSELITPERRAFVERANRLMDSARLTGAAPSAYFLDKCNSEDQATPEQRKDEFEASLSGKSS